MRCDVNLSVRKAGSKELGTRTEIKNLNSFRYLKEAIEYEARWQIETLEDGGSFTQATVLFDPATGTTRAMRSKEDAHDYRYFPDPDLLPLFVSAEWIAREQAALPELPAAKRQRFMADYALSAYDAAILTASLEMADYFEAAVRASKPEAAKLCANWVMVELAARLNREDKELAEALVSAAQLGGLVLRIADGTISNAMAKKVFEALWAGEGESADEIIEKQGLKQISDDGAIEQMVAEVLAANPVGVAEYKAGKEKAFNALVGQVMKVAKGKANPQKVSELLRQRLTTV